jgi:hypothetical protein
VVDDGDVARDAGTVGYAFSPCDYQMHFKSVGVSREAVLVDEGRRGIMRVVSHPSAWPLRGRCVAPLINGTKQIPLLRSDGLKPLLYSGFSRLMILLQLSCPQWCARSKGCGICNTSIRPEARRPVDLRTSSNCLVRVDIMIVRQIVRHARSY